MPTTRLGSKYGYCSNTRTYKGVSEPTSVNTEGYIFPGLAKKPPITGPSTTPRDQQLAVRPMALASYLREQSSDTSVLAMPQIGFKSPSEEYARDYHHPETRGHSKHDTQHDTHGGDGQTSNHRGGFL
jgi:hypothetical protein